MKNEEILMKEHSPYTALIFRKNSKMKWAETGAFVVALGLLTRIIFWQTLLFKISAILIAILVIGLAPIVYRIVLLPIYTLTSNHLYISMRGKEQMIPLSELKVSKDLQFTYLYQGRKINLMVSNEFLEELNEQIAKFKQKGK